MQQFNEIPTLSDRLRQIVELSYTILCNKVAAGSFNVPNEASIQMQLGSIINWVGKMFEFDKHDRVVVELESPKEKVKFNGTYTFLWNVYKEGEGYHCFLKVAF